METGELVGRFDISSVSNQRGVWGLNPYGAPELWGVKRPNWMDFKVYQVTSSAYALWLSTYLIIENIKIDNSP